jgi:hypothetical protein
MHGYNVRLANLIQEFRHYLVEVIPPDFHAFGMPDGLDAEANPLRRRNFQGAQRFCDQRISGSLVLRHYEMLLLEAGRIAHPGPQHSIPVVGLRNDDTLTAGRALNFAAGSRLRNLQLLFAMLALKDDLHRAFRWLKLNQVYSKTKGLG